MQEGGFDMLSLLRFKKRAPVAIPVIRSSEGSLGGFLPEKNFEVNTVNVQTGDGIGKLRILRESDESFYLSFYKEGQSPKDTPVWQSSALGTLAEIDRAWFNCWNGPKKFLP